MNRAIGISFKKLMDATVPKQFLKTQKEAEFGLNTQRREKTYIVSLTSFPARIEDIWISIECILRQSFKPDRILLWLAEEQFEGRELPLKLIELQKRGLEIRYCDDLKAHKKYYYTMKEFPESYVITLDDDLYYDSEILNNLIQLQKANQNLIITNRAHKINFNKSGRITNYRNWQHNVVSDKASHLLFQTGGAGTLFPPQSLDKELFNKPVFQDLCPFADDVWIKLMAYKKGTQIITNRKYNKDPLSIKESQNEKLVTKNVLAGGNDVQFLNVSKYYNLNFEPELGDSKLVNAE
jgi:hypothetical protein